MIEVVSTCVNYSDFLSLTAPRNRPLFDKWVVSTSASDLETIETCGKHAIDVIPNENHLSNNGRFNRGASINAALKAISKKDWVLILDVDIVLPGKFFEAIDLDNLDKTCIHGSPRCMLRSTQEYLFFKDRLNEVNPKMDNVPMRNEVFKNCAAGYFQLFHGSHSQGLYLEGYGGANYTDIEFRNRWKDKRVMLGTKVFHIGPNKVNWRGRVSPRFEP